VQEYRLDAADEMTVAESVLRDTSYKPEDTYTGTVSLTIKGQIAIPIGEIPSLIVLKLKNWLLFQTPNISKPRECAFRHGIFQNTFFVGIMTPRTCIFRADLCSRYSKHWAISDLMLSQKTSGTTTKKSTSAFPVHYLNIKRPPPYPYRKKIMRYWLLLQAQEIANIE